MATGTIPILNPPRSISATIPSTLPTGVSDVRVTAYKSNSVVNLTLRVVLAQPLGSSGAQIASGLPAPPANWSTTATAHTDAVGALVRVTTAGNLMVYYGDDATYNVAFSYPTTS